MARRVRGRNFLDRSRVVLDRSREAAAQFLGGPRHASSQSPPQRPAIEAVSQSPARPAPVESGASEQALIDICASIALRDLNLVDSLLAELEELESREEDDQRLAQLYRLDHLATRLRRNAENLRVLADRDAGDMASDPASLVDAVRAAMSSIDQYSRITIGRVVSLGVVGLAAEDLSRLLAELLDNAANQSPPNSVVRVSAHLTEQASVLIRIEDEGIGLPPDRLRQLNDRLSHTPVLDDDAVRHMGLAVVRRLAARHDMRVALARRLPHGTTATVLLPASLVAELPEAGWSGSQTVVLRQGTTRNGAVRSTGQNATEPVNAPVITGQQATAPSGLPVRTPAPTPSQQAAPQNQPEPLDQPKSPDQLTSPSRAEPERAQRSVPVPVPVPVLGGTTPGGLPRRVSRSLKNPSGERGGLVVETPVEQRLPDPAGHDQLLADLDAFADGEQAARAEQRNSGEADSSPEGKQ